MATHAERVQIAVRHLRKSDPVMREMIDRVGPCQLKLKRDRFALLAWSILSQQISTAAARTIRARVEALVLPERITPQSLLSLSVEQLRGAGVSVRKAEYLHDLAQKATDGTIRLHRVGRMSNEEIIRELTQVRGIGRWTVEMLLMFSLGRLDVFPVDDLSLRNAIAASYPVSQPPGKAELLELATRWSPYESIASWYCWRILEDEEW
ncbi:DNA-3-methyladenine glycosylase 2 family protein [bacterium]|nr:DNA-3-methyladenine glycosylase 2 family protein [bacterium]